MRFVRGPDLFTLLALHVIFGDKLLGVRVGYVFCGSKRHSVLLLGAQEGLSTRAAACRFGRRRARGITVLVPPF